MAVFLKTIFKIQPFLKKEQFFLIFFQIFLFYLILCILQWFKLQLHNLVLEKLEVKYFREY